MKMDRNQENSGFDPLPDDKYLLTVTAVTDKMTAKGWNMARLELTVAEGIYENRKLWHNVTFIPAYDDRGEKQKGHGMCVHACHAFGLEFDGDVDFDTQEFKGKSAYAKVGTEKREWQGKEIVENKIISFVTEDQEVTSPASQNGKEEKIPF